jgi:hypothetical protein
MTDARREAVARLDEIVFRLIEAGAEYEAGRVDSVPHLAEVARQKKALLTWHDAETRALREALEEVTDRLASLCRVGFSATLEDKDQVDKARALLWGCTCKGAPHHHHRTCARALLTPTPGAGEP